MKFIVLLFILFAVAAGGRYVYDNATVTKCHDDKFLWVTIGETCVTEKRFS